MDPLRPALPAAPLSAAPPDDRIARLREAAQSLEASFLAEMLKSAGFGKPLSSFGGGAGEEQFSSLLVQEQARTLAAAGGIGLSEHIFRSLLERENASA
jgi:Rod binding domain-containing protein